MAVADSAAPRFEMGRVLKRTFSVISDNVATFAILALVPGASTAALGWAGNAFTDSTGQPALPDLNTLALFTLGFLFYLASTVVLQGAVVHGTIASLNGKRAAFSDCLATGLRMFVPLFLIFLLATLGMLAGAILLLVPGIMLAVIWAVVIPACAVERTGVFRAFRRSQELTRGYRWPNFGLYVAFIVFIVIISIVVDALTGVGSQIVEMGSNLISTMIVGITSATFGAAIYYELRQLKEGIGPEALASVFD